MNLKKSLTENLGVKLIALVVAMFVWFNASGQKEVAWLKTVPIEILNLPDSLVVNSPVPREVEISITSTRRQLIMMGFKRLKLVVDLAGSTPGRQRVALNSRNLVLPGSIDRRNVRIIEPTGLDLNLERLVSRRVQVTLATAGAIPDGFMLLDGAIAMSPSWVTLRGPASAVERIRSIPTTPLDLSKLKSSGDREMELEYNSRLFTCDPERVTVSVHVSEKGTRVLANVPPTVLVDSDDYEATVHPGTISLTLSGPVAMLDTLSSGDVSVLLDLSGKEAARYKLSPEIILPPGVELSSASVESLVVDVTKNPKRGTP
jgi:YbbR domain-containing protein